MSAPKSGEVGIVFVKKHGIMELNDNDNQYHRGIGEIEMKKIMKMAGIGLAVFLAACGSSSANEGEVLNIYSSRHYDTDRDLFKQFEAETGIVVNVLEGSSIQLLERLNLESGNPQADLFIDVGVTTLYEALQNDLLAPHGSSMPSELEPSMSGEKWLALTNRARAVVYDKEASGTPLVTSYLELADARFADSLFLRSGTHIYNIALVAGLIQTQGEETAQQFVEGVVANMAQEPQGNDRDQARAMIAQERGLSLISTYYLQMLRVSSDPNDVAVGVRLAPAFPDETFVDISWMGVLNGAKNHENAVKLMEFMLSMEAQEMQMRYNGELPVRKDVPILDEVRDLYYFNRMELNYEELGRYIRQAQMMMDKAGWR